MHYRFAAVLALLLLLNSAIIISQTSNLSSQTSILNSQTSNLNSQITLVELNCENLFDCQHDDGKDDFEFLAGGDRHWSQSKYWRKLNNIGQVILSCCDELPDLVALCEVENDRVLNDLTRRSLLRRARYDYLMTESPDVRGIDVALMYQPKHFQPLCYDYITVEPLPDMRPTRDILYVRGRIPASGDTLHVFVVHAPSRYSGEKETRPYRQLVSSKLTEAVAQLQGKKIVVTGDFNDYYNSASLRYLEREAHLENVTKNARGRNGSKGNYRHEGLWRNLDHVLLSPELLPHVDSVYINDALFLLEEDTRYGGFKPRRAFVGFRYQRGFSDHLPLVVRFKL